MPANPQFRYYDHMTMTMTSRLFVVVALASLAACATPPPDPLKPVVPVPPAASAGTRASNENDADDEGVIQVVGIPELGRMEDSPVPASDVPGSGMVCQKEATTGSHRMKRVCRTRTEIEQRRAADTEMIRKLQSKPVAPAPSH